MGDNGQRQSAQPPREPRAEVCNSEQWSQGKSYSHVDPEKMNWSQSGLVEARVEGRRKCIPSRGRGPHKGAKLEVTR